MDQSISLNKYISDSGYCSRREADKLIEAGRVILNDNIAELGSRYYPGDVVEVDGSYIKEQKKEKLVYLAFNKPVGITTTTETEVKGNIISFINYPKRIFPIGRLDKDSEGLIFLTNDGDIVNKVLRAGNMHEKEYIVRVNKPIDSGFIHTMSSGVRILRTKTLPCKVFPIGRQTFRIILTQGLNRQIRRMCETLDYNVVSLQRVRIMNISLDKLAVGKWRYLSEVEIKQLKDSVAESLGTKEASKIKKTKGKTGSSKKQADEEVIDYDLIDQEIRQNPNLGKTRPGKFEQKGSTKLPPGKGSQVSANTSKKINSSQGNGKNKPGTTSSKPDSQGSSKRNQSFKDFRKKAKKR